MAVGPSDEAIDTFSNLTALPRENAVAWLQANNNEVEKATNAFFDSGSAPLPPKAPTVQWSEEDFHQDNTGDGQQGQGLPSTYRPFNLKNRWKESCGEQQQGFNVHPPDNHNPNTFGAPSRPPSRVSNRGGVPATQQYAETEEEQFNRAMAASISESQTMSGQETGVMDPSKPTFGPAQGEYYDTEKWSMTLSGTAHVQEIPLAPEPFDRKRQPGTPPFFRPAPDAPRLSALIKILHEIPIAREALLNKDCLLPDYGHDREWWDGTQIKQLRVVNVDQGYHDANGQDMINETQRLMAFLDKTERAYGSTEGISRLQGRHAEDRTALFFADWQKATAELAENESLLDVFTSVGVQRSPEDGDDRMETFACLPIPVDSDLADKGFSLYDALDTVIWEGRTDRGEVFLKDIGSVVTFNLNCWNASGSGLGIDIPAVWYADRYLETSVQQAKNHRNQRAAIVARNDDLDAEKEKLLKFQPPTNMTVDASSLLAKAIAHLEQTASYRSTKQGVPHINGSMDTGSNVHSDDVLEQLKALDIRISNKLKTFEQAKENLNKQYQATSSFYTAPTDDPDTSPKHKYTLRGVATTVQTCYVLEKTRIEAENNLISLEANDWQWWKLEYVSSDANPVVTMKVSEEDVLTAARTESTSVLLVYANDLAVDHESSPLPSQLANFVRADNLSFQAELDEFIQSAHESSVKRRVVGHDQDDLDAEHPRSPPSNRDQSSEDSLDSNPPDYEIPFSPTPVQSFRQLKPKPGVEGSSDDTIPVSLRGTGSMDSTYMALDQDDTEESGQEMQERSSGTSLLQGRMETNHGYQPGDYVPEIVMEDEEESSDQDCEIRHMNNLAGRGNREDTW